jgi:L-alanine-DL-glutamate epimerase-like enolase superfamily enzyme
MRLVGPRQHSLGGQTGTISKLIIRVDTDAGLYGLGEADAFLGVVEGISYIREYVKGRDPLHVRPLVSELLYGSLPPHHRLAPEGLLSSGHYACAAMSPTATAYGPIVWAASGVEMALCDLVGKALNTPVSTLLGGRFRDRVRVYLDRSAPAQVEEESAWIDLAATALDQGFTQMKFDIDYMAPDCVEDVWNRSISTRQINRIQERLSLVRENVGADFELCVDCHMHYNVPDAIRLAQALAPLQLSWFEDPAPIQDPDAYAQIRSASPIPICAGEMFTAEQFRLFIGREACDILHPDVMFCGGLHEASKIADLGELHHLPLALHGNGGALATVAAAHVASAARSFLGLEYHFIETPWIGEIVKRDVPLFRDGCVPLTEAPGLGVELNADVCRRYLAPGEQMLGDD